MKGMAVLALALIGGLIGGILLNEVIAIMAHMLYEDDKHGLRGLKYLPVVTSLWCAVTVMTWRPRLK